MDSNSYDKKEENSILKFESHKNWGNDENDIVYLKKYDKNNENDKKIEKIKKQMIIDIQDEDIEIMQNSERNEKDNNIIYIDVNNIEKLLKKYNIKNNVEKIIFRYEDEIILTLTREKLNKKC